MNIKFLRLSISVLLLLGSIQFNLYAKKPVYVDKGDDKITKITFWNYLRGLSNEKLKNAGFSGRLETTKAKLGKPLQVNLIDDVQNLKYTDSDVYDITRESDIWLYPIEVERRGIDRIISFLKVLVFKGKYDIQSLCCAKTASDFDKIISIWSKKQGFDLELLKIQKQTEADFVIVENLNILDAEVMPVLVPLPSIHLKPQHNMKKLTAYEFANIHSFLKTFSRNRIKAQGMNPYDIEGIVDPAKLKKRKTKRKSLQKTKIKKLQKSSYANTDSGLDTSDLDMEQLEGIATEEDLDMMQSYVGTGSDTADTETETSEPARPKLKPANRL